MKHDHTKATVMGQPDFFRATTNETKLLAVTQELEKAIAQLNALNPDAEVEYRLMHPSLGRNVARVLLTTTGMIGAMIMTGGAGFPCALIAMTGMFGHGFNEERVTEVTYEESIPFTRTEIREIKHANYKILPVNDDYEIAGITESRDKKSCTVQFYPSYREVEQDGYVCNVRSSKAVAIYVKKENHPDFATRIAQLRSLIHKLEQSKQQHMKTIEAENQRTQKLDEMKML